MKHPADHLSHAALIYNNIKKHVTGPDEA